MDNADYADIRQSLELERAINAARGVPIEPVGGNGRCRECGQDIEPARLKLGLPLCIYCAQAAEIRANQYRGLTCG